MSNPLMEGVDQFGFPLLEDATHARRSESVRHEVERLKDDIRHAIVSMKSVQDEHTDQVNLAQKMGSAIRDLNDAEQSIFNALKKLDMVVNRLRKVQPEVGATD